MDDRLFRKMSTLKISGFLRKPVDEATLKAALERALRHEIIKEATLKVELEGPSASDTEAGPLDTVITGQSEPVADPPQIENEEAEKVKVQNQKP